MEEKHENQFQPFSYFRNKKSMREGLFFAMFIYLEQILFVKPAVPVVLHHAETLSLPEPVLAQTAIHIAVGLLMHRGRATNEGELAAPRPHRLAGVRAGTPLAPSGVEGLVELEHAPRLPTQFPPLDNGEVLLTSDPGLFGFVAAG